MFMSKMLFPLAENTIDWIRERPGLKALSLLGFMLPDCGCVFTLAKETHVGLILHLS